jgi:hypothetical protein
MKAFATKLIRANLLSMGLQVLLLGVLYLCGLDTWLAVGISKAASWGMFGMQLLLAR